MLRLIKTAQIFQFERNIRQLFNKNSIKYLTQINSG